MKCFANINLFLQNAIYNITYYVNMTYYFKRQVQSLTHQ